VVILASKVTLNMQTIISSKLCWPQITVLVGSGFSGLFLRVVKVLRALNLRALRQLDGFGEVIPELPVPTVARHVQQGLGLSVGEDESVTPRISRACACADAGRVASRPLEKYRMLPRGSSGRRAESGTTNAGLKRHCALGGRLLGEHQAHSRLIRRGFAFRHVVDFDHDVGACWNQLRPARLEYVRSLTGRVTCEPVVRYVVLRRLAPSFLAGGASKKTFFGMSLK